MVEGVHGRVIIIGGGISGLATALALRGHFEHILVLERDAYPGEVCERRTTVQGHHVHVLLARGLSELTQLVPELPAWFDEHGLPEADLTADIWLAQAGRWLPRRRCGIATRPCTRPLLEFLLRRAARQHANIELRAGQQVEGLLGQARVEGVRARDEQGCEQELRAQLVVDAAGRNSRATRWLEELGHGSVELTVVDAQVSYASCLFEPKPGVELPCSLMAVTGMLGEDPRFATIMRAGGGRWLTAMINYVGSPPPAGVEEYLEQYARLSVPDLRELLDQARPSSEVRLFTNTANRRRHFTRLRSWPERYVVLGDAACSLNPRFGQGMTVAVVGANLLARTLASRASEPAPLDGLARAFQRRLDAQLDTPWQIATAEDSTWLALSRGQLSLGERLSAAGARRLFSTMNEDYDTYVRVNRVAHMIDPMRTLASPGTIAKLLFPALRSL